jgi:hypothetical protein
VGPDLGVGTVAGAGARPVSVTAMISPDLFGEVAAALLGFDLEQCAGSFDAAQPAPTGRSRSH